jgi:predicted amidohydrolase
MFDVELTEGPGYRESSEASPGDEIVVCGTELGKIGLAVCYDLRFPELFRIMAARGAELLVVSANFTQDTGRAHWEPLLRARAIENTCYVAAAGQCGRNDSFTSYGNSMIVDPWGEVIARAGTEEEIIYAEVDAGRIRDVRTQIPSLANVRGDVYRLEPVPENG